MVEKQCLNADGAPPAVGPYSHAVRAGQFLFLSGQVGLMPDGTKPVSDRFEDEARRVLTNLRTVLEQTGSGLEQVVKTTVYLSDMGLFKTFNGIYEEFFNVNPPARACVQIARLPLDFRVEIDAVAIIPD